MQSSLCLLGLVATVGALFLQAPSIEAQPRAATPARRVLRAATAPALALPRMGPAPRLAPRPRVRRAGLLRASMRPSSPVVTVLQRMETTLQHTRFSPNNRVDPLMGHYEFDAPGLVTWVLRRATPAAHRALFARVRARSPTARDYHDFLSAAVADQDAWQRIGAISELRPGDVIAWRRPPGMHAGGTHVAFVAAVPVRTPAAGGGWLVRVTDSTAVPHDNDTRGPQSRHHSGIGTGTLLLGVDARGEVPTSYGWVGVRTVVPIRTSIVMGRPLR